MVVDKHAVSACVLVATDVVDAALVVGTDEDEDTGAAVKGIDGASFKSFIELLASGCSPEALKPAVKCSLLKDLSNSSFIRPVNLHCCIIMITKHS